MITRKRVRMMFALPFLLLIMIIAGAVREFAWFCDWWAKEWKDP